VYFLLEITELFSLSVTAEVLQQKLINNQHFGRGRSVLAKFSCRRARSQLIIFAQIDGQ